jgi:HK97 family phage portal protein
LSQRLLSDASVSADVFQRVLKSAETDGSAALLGADYQKLGPMAQRAVMRTLQRKALQLRPLSHSGGWYSLIHEPYTGAWQKNEEVRLDTALSFYAVYACTRLITTDVGKLGLRLVEQDADGIWTPTESPAFSPVLREPNRYQTINKFIEQWVLSLLQRGNAYILKVSDGRGVTVAMHVLDPTRVKVLVAPDSSVYYELKRDDLSHLNREVVTVPESAIIHDRLISPHHPLIGLSPLYACAYSILTGMAIQGNSAQFFETRSTPNAILTAPIGISDEQASAIKANWVAMAPGDIAVLSGDLKYQPLSQSAVESDLIKQLQMTAEQVCSAFGVPPYLVDIGPPPPYANFEPLLLKYHSQVIQSLTTNIEKALDKGLGLNEKVGGRQYGTEFDIDDLIWMDTATRVTSAQTSIASGGMSPDEARKKYFGLGPVAGGNTPYMQQQNWPLAQLAERDAPSDPSVQVRDDDEMDVAAAWSAIRRKLYEVEHGARS